MKRQGWLALSFSLAALILRLPFASRYLYHWDSVNYALSLEKYDVRLHQPHPPGYFLYSMLGKLVNLIFHDANTSLVVISLIFGSLAIGALYWLGYKLVNEKVGLAAAFLGLFSPLLWYESEVALNYTMDFFLVSIVCLLFIRIWRGETRLWFWSAILFGITGGVRIHDLVFLGPLWLLSLVKLNWKQRILSLVTLGLVCLAWFIPMASLSGGFAGYIEAFKAESAGITSEASVFILEQLGLNTSRLAIYLAYGILAGAVPLAWGLVHILRNWRSTIHHSLLLPLVLWLTPAIFFFILIHIRQAGHVIILMPAMLLMAGWAVVAWGEKIGKPKFSYWLLVTLSLVNLGFFLAAPKALLGSNRLPMQTPTRASLVTRDVFLSERINYIRENFDPESTVILAGGLNIRHPDFYLSEFQRTDLSYRISADPVALPEQIQTLILFDDQVLPELPPDSVAFHPFPDGTSLRIFNWNNGQEMWISTIGLEIRERK